MKILTKAAKIFLLAVLILGVLLLICYINHRIQLSREEKILRRIGSSVEVDGNSMNVYTEDEGDDTPVFMSGGKTCSPMLDFKSLYTLLSGLSGEYRIAVVEKFGYGFSDVVDKERDINSIVRVRR
ncbi:MAG: hypothetical protein NC395_07085 [Prevotella sp.]|nr:hypothetical protein [Prevotella sp.]